MAKSQNTKPAIALKHFASVDEIERALTKLRRRVPEVSDLKPSGTRHDAPEGLRAFSNVDETILDVFGPNSPEHREYRSHRLRFLQSHTDPSEQELQQAFDDGIPHVLAMLEGLIKRLQEKRLDFAPSSPSAAVVKPGAIFLGHGHSREWLALQDFLQKRLCLQCVEFNTESAAGVGITERLEELLDQTCFAFLVMTAEDEQPDGSRRARENVVHEAGLFQGRLTFRKAIVVLEEGCAEFSNIHGLVQIPFPKGKIQSCFEDVRRVLEREKVVMK